MNAIEKKNVDAKINNKKDTENKK